VAGERPHLTVIADIETLERRAGRRCELDDAGRIPPEAVRRLACDAHHVVHWADGGPTSLSNLVLLCRPHHRAVHQGKSERVIGNGVAIAQPGRPPVGARAP
jgi:hypothetical protein